MNLIAAQDQTLNLQLLLEQIKSENGLSRLFWLFFPFFILVDLPLTLIVFLGVLRWGVRETTLPAKISLYRPKVSCLVICYSEGWDVLRTLQSLCEQTYQGEIELIPIVDGATANKKTLEAVRSFHLDHSIHNRRSCRPVAKWQRGGRVSSLNAGLSLCTGTIVMALDGDTSFDNNMVSTIVRHFEDPNVPAVAGSLRVRNTWASLSTAVQAIEYLVAIQMAKTGLSEWNLVNNVSGAFGAFRKSFISHIGGWSTHTAEDLDMTIRIKRYFGRNNRLRIPFEPRAIGHTDAPVTFLQFLNQRLRWDGDLLFIYWRKNSGSFNPRLVGWPNLLMLIYYGLLVQVISPFIIIIYTTYTMITWPWPTFAAMMSLVYIVYLVLILVQFLLTLAVITERPAKDARLLLVLPIYPLIMFIIRCWGAVAMLNEVFRRGHEESSMAPWWVMRSKRF